MGVFAEGKGQERSQDIFNKIWAKTFQLSSPINCPPSEPSYTTAASWLDNIVFPADTWKDVQSIKWSYNEPLSFVVERYFSVKAEYVSNIGPDEKIEKRMDRAFWAKNGCGFGRVRGIVDSKFLWKSKVMALILSWSRCEKLEAAIGGKGSETILEWPVVLLLATRRWDDIV